MTRLARLRDRVLRRAAHDLVALCLRGRQRRLGAVDRGLGVGAVDRRATGLSVVQLAGRGDERRSAPSAASRPPRRVSAEVGPAFTASSFFCAEVSASCDEVTAAWAEDARVHSVPVRGVRGEDARSRRRGGSVGAFVTIVRSASDTGAVRVMQNAGVLSATQ